MPIQFTWTYLIDNKQFVLSVHFCICNKRIAIVINVNQSIASYKRVQLPFFSFYLLLNEASKSLDRSCIKCLVLKLIPLEEKMRTLSLLVHLPFDKILTFVSYINASNQINSFKAVSFKDIWLNI